jgi:hypothetical protein
VHFIRLLVFIFAVAVSLTPAAAERLGSDVAYSATWTLRLYGQELVGRHYYDHGKERYELTVEGERLLFITRPDLGLSFIIFPDLSRGEERNINDGFDLPTVRAEDVERRTMVSRETLQGETTTKYRLDDPGGTVWLWVTTDGISLRLMVEGEKEEFGFFLTDVRRGPQPPHLFEVPEGIDFAKSGEQ